MLGRLAANLRERQGIAGTGIEGLGAMGEHATVVLDENCTVCPAFRLSSLFDLVLTNLQVM